MQLISLGIKGFMGASFERGLCLENMGRVNLLVGPNNSGKSIPYRAMQILSLVESGSSHNPDLHWVNSEASGQVTTQCWFKEETSHPFEFDLVLELDQNIIKGVQDISAGHFRTMDAPEPTLDLSIVMRDPIQPRASINPKLKLDEEVLPAVESSSRYGSPRYLLDRHRYTTDSKVAPRATQAILESKLILQRTRARFRFVASIRDTKRAGVGSALPLLDGSQLTDKIIGRLEHKDKEKRKYLAEILAQINDVLSFNGRQRFHRFHVSRDESKTISLEDGEEFRSTLSSLGTGVEALVILITEIMLEEQPCIYFLEEPEHHMHPGLAARFLQFLKTSCSQHQFLISTHSHTLLDCLGKEDRVYRFWKTAAGECMAEQCKEFTDYHRTLDLLGVRASSLLQVNSVIWVEGPSDIEYLRGWMEAIGDADPSKRLVENSDYAFVIYGGSNIAHLTAGDLDSGESNQIHMLKICRRAALVADKDGGERAELKDHVRRLKGEFKRHAAARVFTTQNREIENELPVEVLRQALRATFPDKLKKFRLETFTPTNDERVPAQIQALKPGHKLGTKKNEWDALYNQRKTRLAAKAVEIIKAGRYPSPPYIAELVDFILEGREPEKAEGSKLQNADGAG